MSENAWIEWSGGECPVAPDTLVDTRDRAGNQCFGFRASDCPCVGFWNRAWRGRSRDIIAYRLSGPSA